MKYNPECTIETNSILFTAHPKAIKKSLLFREIFVNLMVYGISYFHLRDSLTDYPETAFIPIVIALLFTLVFRAVIITASLNRIIGFERVSDSELKLLINGNETAPIPIEQFWISTKKGSKVIEFISGENVIHRDSLHLYETVEAAFHEWITVPYDSSEPIEEIEPIAAPPEKVSINKSISLAIKAIFTKEEEFTFTEEIPLLYRKVSIKVEKIRLGWYLLFALVLPLFFSYGGSLMIFSDTTPVKQTLFAIPMAILFYFLSRMGSLLIYATTQGPMILYCQKLLKESGFGEENRA